MDVRALAAADTDRLLTTIIELSHVRELEAVVAVVRRAARTLTGADGVSFVLREGDRVFYADEDAIGPLWKGQRFASSECVSGWAMDHRETVVIGDVYADDRVPHDVYRPTFVKSLAMIPIRVADPVGAIGAYWARVHETTAREIALLEALASASAAAIQNAELLGEARRAARLREDFLAIVSHEVRTPLSALMIHLGALQRALGAGGALDRARVLERAAGIERSAKRMNELVEHLLETTRTMSGRVLVVPARIDLSELVGHLVEQVSETATRAGCEIRVSTPGPLIIEGDAERLSVVVSNLLTNAIKYGARKPIEVTVEPLGIGARLSIRDRGIGIARKDQARIFDPFERAVSPSRYGGFGVGLWAARKMVEAHGGRIEVTSEPGEGSLFVVELLHAADAPQAVDHAH